MMGHLPAPYADELLASVLARCRNRFDFPSSKQVGVSAFGRSTSTKIVDCPMYLDVLAASIPSTMGITADALIDNNTLWPYFAAFRTPECRETTRSEMRTGGYPYLRLGLMASRSAWPRYYRYCALCAERDREQVLEAYWHRAHQVPGIEGCHRHGVLLRESSILFRHDRNRHEYRAAETSIPDAGSPSVETTLVQDFLAKSAAWLLNQPDFFVLEQHLKKCFQARLIDLGYATQSGRIRLEKLKHEFSSKYAPAWLRGIGCDLGYGTGCWIADIVRSRPRSRHPIRLLLFMHFLGLKVEHLLETDSLPHPFGRGPWPCLNRASAHYGTPSVQECVVRTANNGRSLAGTFECDGCGMIYRRFGPDTGLSARMRRDYIPKYGPTWDSALEQLWTDGISLRAASKRLGVDTTTVKLQAARLGLAPRSRGGTQVQYRSRLLTGPKGDPEEYKASWKKLRDDTPAATRTQLRQALPGV